MLKKHGSIVICSFALCFNRDSPIRFMLRSWFAHSLYVSIVIRPFALCFDRDSPIRFMFQSWFAHSLYVSIVIRPFALCFNRDSPIRFMFQSWFAYSLYVSLVIRPFALCFDRDSPIRFVSFVIALVWTQHQRRTTKTTFCKQNQKPPYWIVQILRDWRNKYRYPGSVLFNQLPRTIKEAISLFKFKNLLKQHFIRWVLILRLN